MELQIICSHLVIQYYFNFCAADVAYVDQRGIRNVFVTTEIIFCLLSSEQSSNHE